MVSFWTKLYLARYALGYGTTIYESEGELESQGYPKWVQTVLGESAFVKLRRFGDGDLSSLKSN